MFLKPQFRLGRLSVTEILMHCTVLGKEPKISLYETYNGVLRAIVGAVNNLLFFSGYTEMFQNLCQR